MKGAQKTEKGGAEARSVDDNEEDNKDKLRCVLPALE